MISSNAIHLANAFYRVLGDETLRECFYRVLGEEISSRTKLRESLFKACITDLHSCPSDLSFLSDALARVNLSGISAIQRDTVFNFYLSNILGTVLCAAIQIDKSLRVSLRNVLYDALTSNHSLKEACVTVLANTFPDTVTSDRILYNPLNTVYCISILATAPLENPALFGDIARNVIFQNPAILTFFRTTLNPAEGDVEQSVW